ncbi:MAG: competence/damage-inducible protein A [Alphaproteobacteria bacterium]|jgi:molybdenum cofactor synthesis domain-containing protein|nr:competence/damage-inducible protein A [Alphaproteobacteria bacterium]MBT5389516.1 competence/damage-inducible protein A [Alphaproteobacteria bacterium]MBT5540396.1 competence/damage-inducible protein A [Alphaproteobacteria bacterium]MBT5654921.1 competence/damage-inducible protein A [Alphaproteobacteria bacterium]
MTKFKSFRENPTACVLIIGNEILSGRTPDENVQYIGKGLADLGIYLQEVRIIPDIDETIIETVREVKEDYNYVFTTGGIGPTHDDITAACIAEAVDLPLEYNEEVLRRLEEHYGDDLTDSRKKMAQMPVGAILINNPETTAPGFQIENIFVLAGVPYIMRSMFEALIPTLERGSKVFSRTINCFLAEGIVAKPLTELQKKHSHIDIGSYPFYLPEGHGTSLVARGIHEELLDEIASELSDLISDCGALPFTETPEEFAEQQKNLDTSKMEPLPKKRKFRKRPSKFVMIGCTALIILGVLLIMNLPSPSDTIRKTVECTGMLKK